MNPSLRMIGQIAALVRQQLTQLHDQHLSQIDRRVQGFAGLTERLLQLKRQLAQARARNWSAATRRILDQLQIVSRDLVYAADAQARRLDNHRSITRPTDRQIAEELEQLTDEFGGWQWNATGPALSVVTESVVLEDMDLGRFEIALNLAALGDPEHRAALAVIALDPSPAAGHSAVTHPHVSDERLCEGDAAEPLARALAEGRLADYFLLVRSVLTTYNPDSPYVALDQWYGEPCYECGDRVEDDQRFWCEGCDHDFCGACVGWCAGCEQTRCLECLSICPACQESNCRHCMAACEGCGASCCRRCLENNPGRCPDCQEGIDDDDQQAICSGNHSQDTCVPQA